MRVRRLTERVKFERAAGVAWGGKPFWSLTQSPVLFYSSAALICLLALLRIAGVVATIELPVQLLLVVVFTALVVKDLKAAVLIALIELATAGAAGHWTVFPGGVSGRIVIDAIVFGRALWLFAASALKSRTFELGRYGAHALVVAIGMPVIWCVVGLLYGNRPSEVFADADGYAFIAFSLVFIVVMRMGGGDWLRRAFFTATAVNALFMFGLIVIAALQIVPLWPNQRNFLLDGPTSLDFGGAVGYMPGGAWRLYLGSGVYLPAALVLVVWRLLREPRSIGLWALYGIVLVDLAVSYTRGFWLAAIAASAIVLIAGKWDVRGAAEVVAGACGFALVAVAIGAVLGFSVPDYLVQRASSAVVAVAPPSSLILPTPTTSGAHPSPSPSSSPTPTPGGDSLGEIGNGVRLAQIQVLVKHIEQRPLFGSGFGAIATDYQYGFLSTYEISYLDLAFKTGLIGAALFMSLVVRFLIDCLRGRVGRLALPAGVSPTDMVVPAAVIVAMLVAGATNPYLFAAYGVTPIIIAIAWLDPLGSGSSGGDGHGTVAS
jgi:hypothetical protein